MTGALTQAPPSSPEKDSRPTRGSQLTRQGRSICALDIPEYRTSPQKSTNVTMGKLRARRSHVMNAFVEHHAPSIQFGYRCFDRLLLNGLIQPFQQPERVIGFFNAYRGGQRVTRDLLRNVAAHYHHGVKPRSIQRDGPLL